MKAAQMFSSCLPKWKIVPGYIDRMRIRVWKVWPFKVLFSYYNFLCLFLNKNNFDSNEIVLILFFPTTLTSWLQESKNSVSKLKS